MSSRPFAFHGMQLLHPARQADRSTVLREIETADLSAVELVAQNRAARRGVAAHMRGASRSQEKPRR